jgi:hypothetical protein
MRFAVIVTVAFAASCIRHRCEEARERAAVCGREFEDECDGDLTQRQRCEHRCLMRSPCWDVDFCVRDECLWPYF